MDRRIVCVGEGMLELSRKGDGWRMGHGGDTLNTAIHLAREGHHVAYFTALGGDALSEGMKQAWQAEGLDCSLVLTHPARQSGLYAITTDDEGERSFTYWRDTSAARDLFAIDGVEHAFAQAASTDLLAFSLISLAILPPEGRQRLLDLASRVRANGGKVAFDGNYRPRLWSSAEETRAARDAAIAVSDIGLPTLEDEQLLRDGASMNDIAAHWQGLGCTETIVKLGAKGCLLPSGEVLPPPQTLRPVDTSGAGDAFNAGYLSARLGGAGIADAARAGHERAGWTIMRRGAIPARET